MFSQPITLLIVDMQRGAAEGRYHGHYLNCRWWDRYEAVTANILRLSAHAAETIFVTDTGFRKPEHVEIVKPLHALSRRSRQYFKTVDDGSTAVADVLPPERPVLVVGMNTNACIKRTARGLLKLGFNVAVAGDACWTAYAAASAQPHYNGLRSVRRAGIPVIKTEDFCNLSHVLKCD